jgi:phage head maturation protease
MPVEQLMEYATSNIRQGDISTFSFSFSSSLFFNPDLSSARVA